MREQIYAAMQANDGPVSSRELADRFETTLAIMNYHLIVLARAEKIRMTGTVQVNGSGSSFYRLYESLRS